MTQPGDVRKFLGHISKKTAIGDGLGGGPAARIAEVDDYEGAVVTNAHVTGMHVVRSGNAGRGALSDAGRGSGVDIQQILLERMERLCCSVQDLGKQMKDGFAAEVNK